MREAAKINMANIEKNKRAYNGDNGAKSRTTRALADAGQQRSRAGGVGEEGEGSPGATGGKRGVGGGHRKIHNVTPNREE